MTNEKILIVDDTAANIHLLAGVLEPRGYEILTASNADQALEGRGQDPSRPDSARRRDARDGRLRGLPALKEHEATRAIPVLFVTAKDDTESLLRGFRCGAVDYISKPFQSDEVLVRVETHLQIARLTRELIERNRELETEIGRRREAEGARHAATRAARHAVRTGHAAVGHFRVRRAAAASCGGSCRRSNGCTSSPERTC